MKKVKLIIGSVNNNSISIKEKSIDEVYEKSYKPFLRLVHKKNLPVTMYYAGELLSWIIDKHDGMQMLFNDLIKDKKIEVLGGGYYSPLFSLIPRKDRVSQIEMMTTEIRRRFGKRPRGIWITEKIWEPSMPMTLYSSGMEFTFLDEEFFEDAGLFNGELFQPCITEDQGKKVIIYPISNRFISQFSTSSPEELLDHIIEMGSDREERVVTMLLPGEELLFDKETSGKLEKFFDLISSNDKRIEVILPGKYCREVGGMRKVYFGCVSPGDIGRWSGPVFREKLHDENEDDFNSEKSIINQKPVNTQSFFRHFLAKYPESNYLYSRMMDVHVLISQLRGDKQRKKSAAAELFKSQNHSAFWHGGGGPGIYSSEARRRAYAGLIEAEKFTREKTGFRASLVKDDFDMDGLDELVYRGLSLNVNIHRKGGCIFQLDYFRTPHNYIDTMARHREWYHQDGTWDTYTRNTFIDHFFQPEEVIDNFYSMKYRENGDFVSGIFSIDKYSKEGKEVLLSRCGSVFTKKKKFSVELKKKYSFKRNIIILEYEITNKSDSVLTTKFGSEINLSFSSRHGSDIDLELLRGAEKKECEQRFSEDSVTEFQIIDKRRKALLYFNSDIECELWGFPVTTSTGTGKKIEKLYQGNCFTFVCPISLGPGKTWTNKIQLRIERHSKRAKN